MIFSAKNRIFDDFGIPGVSLAEVLGRILDRKFWDEKKDEKQMQKEIASACDADLQQDPPAELFWYPKSTKAQENCNQKNHQKNNPHKNYFFGTMWHFRGRKHWILMNFWDDFDSPGASFSDVFWGWRFWTICDAFFVKILRNAKTRQVAFVS